MPTPSISTLTAFRCPLCREFDNEVKDSRPRSDGYIYRRRYCRACSSTFTTVEIPAELWTSSRIDLELATAADALNQTVTAFNALRRAYRTVRKSSSAKTLFLRNREPRDG